MSDGTVSIGNESLRCVLVDNRSVGAHGQGYNGILSLEGPPGAASPFVPRYAGLNLEHYFDTRAKPDSDTWFEPRRSAMSVQALGDTVAELHQPQTAVFGVESRTRVAVASATSLDISFRMRRLVGPAEPGFLGVFWASYMHQPEDKSIYFLRAGSTLSAPRWVQLCTQVHGHASSVAHADDTDEPAWAEPEAMLYANPSPVRYAVPFFYGRWQDRVLIYMFKPGPTVRFAHSPSGGGSTEDGQDTCPAWDFQLLIGRCATGVEYGLDLRLVYKPWRGRTDVLAEVASFMG